MSDTGLFVINKILQPKMINENCGWFSSVDDHLGTVKQIKYEEIREIDKWRIPIIQEAIDIKCGKINPPDGWTAEELDAILNFACTE